MTEADEMIEQRRKERVEAYARIAEDRQSAFAFRMETALPFLTKLTWAERCALAEWAWTQELIARADERTRTLRSMSGGEWSMNREM